MNDFHFMRPYYFFLLIPFAILLLALWTKKRKGGAWSQFCAKHLLPYILDNKSATPHRHLALLSFIGILSITALAGPSWQQIAVPLLQENSGLVIALDLSPQMYAEDIKPNRYQRALYKISDILQRRTEGQTALIVYTDEAFVVTPLTEDAKNIAALLPAIDPTIMPTHGLNHSKAIAKATELLHQAGVDRGSIFLITSDIGNAELISEIPVSILGVGTEQGAPIPKPDGSFKLDAKGAMILSKSNPKAMAQQAQSTGGKFAILSSDDTDINYLLDGIKNSTELETKEAVVHTTGLDEGYWLILLTLPLAALILRRGGYLAIPLIIATTRLHAFSWTDLWLTPDQQGERAFSHQDYAEAATTFQDNNWQAAAHFKNENYEEAAKLYEQDNTPDGYYNYGNALAKQGLIDEAITAYEKALELKPDHEDAEYNKNLLEKLKDQSQQNDQEGQDQDNKNKDKDKNKKNNKDKDKKKNSKDKDKGDDKEQDQDQQKGDQDKEQEQPDDKSNDSQDENKKSQQDKKKSQQDDHDSKQNEDTTNELSPEEKEQLRQEIEKEMQKGEPQKDRPVADEQLPDEDPQKELDDRLLQRIADDPGTLLRRKFLYQYRNQKGGP